MLFLCSLSILAGDVERNPRPRDLEKLEGTLDILVQSTQRYQFENASKLSSFADGVISLTERVTQLENKLEDISCAQDSIVAVKAKMVALKNDVKLIAATRKNLCSAPSGLDSLGNAGRT